MKTSNELRNTFCFQLADIEFEAFRKRLQNAHIVEFGKRKKISDNEVRKTIHYLLEKYHNELHQFILDCYY